MNDKNEAQPMTVEDAHRIVLTSLTSVEDCDSDLSLGEAIRVLRRHDKDIMGAVAEGLKTENLTV